MSNTKEFTPLAGIEGKLEEPWVDLPGGRELAGWGREEEIAYNQVNRQTEKALFYRRTFDFLTDNRVLGDYYEFGCHRCPHRGMAASERVSKGSQLRRQLHQHSRRTRVSRHHSQEREEADSHLYGRRPE